MRIFFLFIHYNAEFLAIKETIILHFKCAPLRAFTLFPIFSNSVMWKPYHIFAHLSYLFHLIPNILLSPSAIFFLALPYQSLCVCVCPICLFDSLASLPLSPSLLCVFIIGDYFPFFSSCSWSNNISFIFYVNFIRFDVIKKPFFRKDSICIWTRNDQTLKKKHIPLAEILNSSESALLFVLHKCSFTPKLLSRRWSYSLFHFGDISRLYTKKKKTRKKPNNRDTSTGNQYIVWMCFWTNRNF